MGAEVGVEKWIIQVVISMYENSKSAVNFDASTR